MKVQNRQELKIKSKSTELSKLNYKIDNLKKQIKDTKDLIHRGKMRMHQQNELFKKQNNDINKEVEILTNKQCKNDAELGQLDKEIKLLKKKIEDQRENQEKVKEAVNQRVESLFQLLSGMFDDANKCVKHLCDDSYF